MLFWPPTKSWFDLSIVLICCVGWTTLAAFSNKVPCEFRVAALTLAPCARSGRHKYQAFVCPAFSVSPWLNKIYAAKSFLTCMLSNFGGIPFAAGPGRFAFMHCSLQACLMGNHISAGSLCLDVSWATWIFTTLTPEIVSDCSRDSIEPL